MSQQTTEQRVPTWTVGDRLRKARETSGLSQAELAAAIGISPRTVGNYESDRTHVRRPVLLAWALETHVPMQWLIKGDSDLLHPDTPGNMWPSCSRPRPASIHRLVASRPSDLLHWVARVTTDAFGNGPITLAA